MMTAVMQFPPSRPSIIVKIKSVEIMYISHSRLLASIPILGIHACPLTKVLYTFTIQLYVSVSDESPTIEFSRKVDPNGRLVVPKDVRRALSIDGRDALVKFEAQKITFLDNRGDSSD